MKRSMKAGGIGSTGAAFSLCAAPPSGEGWRAGPWRPPRSARAAGCSRPRGLSAAADAAGTVLIGLGAVMGFASALAFDAQLPVEAQGAAFVGLALSFALIGGGAGWGACRSMEGAGGDPHGTRPVPMVSDVRDGKGALR